MTIIWLTAEMPFPPNTGGRIGMFKRIEYFSKENDVYLFSIIDKNIEAKYSQDLQKYCKTVNLYCREGRMLRNLFGLIRAPYVCESRWFSKMKQDIDKTFGYINPDYVIVDFPQMLGNISESIFNSGRVILNQHNTEYQTLRNISKIFKNPVKRVAGFIESYRLEKIEKKYYKRKPIKLFTFVSLEDKMFFERKYGLTNTLLVPVGTETKILEKQNKNDIIISYIGKMEYPSNAEAAVWFANNVFVGLKENIPNVKFYVVGKNPISSVKELADKDSDIIVTGTVESVDEYYENTDIVVIPLFHGGGVKVKLLEALGHKKLVITTKKGVEGTIFKNGQELIVAENADQYKDVINDIYTNPKKYEIIKETGYKCIEDNFTWAAIVRKYEEKLKSMI